MQGSDNPSGRSQAELNPWSFQSDEKVEDADPGLGRSQVRGRVTLNPFAPTRLEALLSLQRLCCQWSPPSVMH